MSRCARCGGHALAAGETEDGPLCHVCVEELELTDERRLEAIAEEGTVRA